MNYKDKLGQASWNFLHTFSEGIPQNISNEDEVALNKFLKSMSNVYPCTHCRPHFKRMVRENEFSQKRYGSFKYYICNIHNKVNKRLGKPVYNCKI